MAHSDDPGLVTAGPGFLFLPEIIICRVQHPHWVIGIKDIQSIRDESFLSYEATIVPHLNSPVIEAYKKLRKRFPEYTLDWYFSFYSEEGESSSWILSADDQFVKSSLLLRNAHVLQLLFEEWETQLELYDALIAEMSAQGIQDLERDYVAFIEAYESEFSPALIIESFYAGLDRHLKDIVRKYPGEKQAIHCLLEPRKRCFHHDEMMSLVKIAMEIRANGSEAQIQNLLRRHQESFFWIQNNYKHSDPISLDTFQERALDLAESGKDLQSVYDSLEDYERQRSARAGRIHDLALFTEDEARMLDWCSKIAWWQDQRKKANLIADYWLNEFIKRIAEKYRYSILQIQHAEIPEIFDLFKGIPIEKEILETRMKYSLHCIDTNGDSRLIEGDEAKMLRDALLPEETYEEGQLRGMTGAVGIAQGPVRIISDPKRQQLKPGEILVAGMTRPEYLHLMKLAAAVVTNEGGVTCHAAIVCRELGIPCVIGTKNATKILKDGDEILVNANHAFVTIMDRA